MKFGALGLLTLFLLSSCATSPSLEDQTKLLEYEKCITAEEISFTALTQSRTREELQVFFDAISKGDPLVSEFIKKCAKYRP
jgi:hypothetical protein